MIHVMKSKKFMFSLLSTILIAIGIGFVVFLNAPNNYVAIDINPSIEIETNRLNKVVKITAANEDAQKLLEGMKLTNRDIEEVVIDIMDKLVKAGYIKQGNENEILLTVANSSTSAELLGNVNKTIATILEGKKLQAKLIDQTIDLNDEILKAAHEQNVSAGKYNVIEKIAKDNDKVTLEELSSVKISDLFEYAKSNKVDFKDVLEEYQDTFEDIMEDQQDAIEDDKDEDDKDDDDKDDDDKDDDDKGNGKDKNINKDAIHNPNLSTDKDGTQAIQNNDNGKDNADKTKANDDKVKNDKVKEDEDKVKKDKVKAKEDEDKAKKDKAKTKDDDDKAKDDKGQKNNNDDDDDDDN